MAYPYRRPQNDEKRYIFGRFIREPKVYCIDQNNTNLGLMDTPSALKLAQDADLELVLVSHGQKGQPSTCRILDLSKYKYEQEKKEKAIKKKQRENAIKVKELNLRPCTDDNDLLTKARQFQDFINEGNRLKVQVKFRGREMAHTDLGLDILNRFCSMVSARYDVAPSVTGKNMVAVLVRDQEKEAVG